MKKRIKIAAKTLYKNFRFWLSANNSILFTGFYRFFYFPQKSSLDGFLNAYSKENRGRLIVIQVGANDGITHDPIHKFIKRDHWKGVLLEPQKYVFENFLSKIYRKDKGIVPLNAALGAEEGVGYMYRIAFSDSRWAHGLSSFDKETLLDAFRSGHVERQAQKENIRVPENPDEQIATEEVRMISPEGIVQQYGLRKVDLLMVDAEGYDVEIVKLFMQQDILPRVIIFEKGHLDAETLEGCNRMLLERGYAYRNAGANTVAMLHPVGKYEAWFCMQ